MSPLDASALTSVFRPGLLDGQVALVTGGGTGIGLGISQLLAGLGAHVVIASRKPEHLETALATIASTGGSASTVALDVRQQERVKEVVDGIAQQHGRLDVLVNNAAGNFYAPAPRCRRMRGRPSSKSISMAPFTARRPSTASWRSRAVGGSSAPA